MTVVLVEPETVALNCCVPPVRTLAVAGVTAEMETTTGAVTVTVAVEVLVGSAAAVAVMVTVPAVAGAVNSPDAEIVPALADQLTAVLVVPETVALNCCVPPVRTFAVAGVTAEIETTIGDDVIVTVAVENLVGSAAEVAVTVTMDGPAVPSAEAAPWMVALPLPRSVRTVQLTFSVWAADAAA